MTPSPARSSPPTLPETPRSRFRRTRRLSWCNARPPAPSANQARSCWSLASSLITGTAAATPMATVCPTGGKADTTGASPTRCRKAPPPTDSTTFNATGSGWTRPIPAPLSRRKPRANRAPVTHSSPGIPSAARRYAVEYADILDLSGTSFTQALTRTETNVPAGVEGTATFRGRLHPHRRPARPERALLPGQVG